MGLLFPECFKTTPVKPEPQLKIAKSSRTSSTSSSKTLVEFDSDDESSNSPFIRKKIHQTPSNQYIVTTFVNSEKIDGSVYDDTTDTEEDVPFVPRPIAIPLILPELTTTFPSNRKYTLFACKNCHNHICISNFMISNNFTGKSGDLFLVSNIINYTLGAVEKREMITGRYDVCDVKCKQCENYLGWKYLKADSNREKYKMGKYVIEKLLFEQISVLGS